MFLTEVDNLRQAESLLQAGKVLIFKAKYFFRQTTGRQSVIYIHTTNTILLSVLSDIFAMTNIKQRKRASQIRYRYGSYGYDENK